MYVENVRLVDRCVCDLLSWLWASSSTAEITAARCAWSATSHRWSSKPVYCKILILVSSFYQEIPESVIEHHSLLIPYFLIKSFFSYHFEKFTDYLLNFMWQWRLTNKTNKYTAYLQRVFIPVSRYVKIIKIHQHFPELWSQVYCHLVSQFTLYFTSPNPTLQVKSSVQVQEVKCITCKAPHHTVEMYASAVKLAF